ncbi:MAG: diguanylate cyclase (GGDEF)-like protein [Mariniblastus sp.]|jgi:diguanylate cyclase (GGDEF)-like protein
MISVIEMILSAEDLPTPPSVALKLLDLNNRDSVEVEEMAAVIGIDPVLTAKLIEYCNSPLLARANKITSIERSIVVIGMRAVKILALSFSLVRTVSSSSSKFDYDQFWSRSLATAVVAKTIGLSRKQDGNEEFLLGLMLKIGQVGLAHTFPSRYTELQQQAEATGVPIRTLEEDEWNANHLNVSVSLLNHWNFPEEVTARITAYTHAINNEGSTSEDETASTFVKTLQLTEQIVSMIFAPNLLEVELEKATSMAQELLGIDGQEFAVLFDQANESWAEFAVLLNFDASQAQTFEQLERRALKGIAMLSIGLHTENAVISEENAVLKVNAMVDSLTGLKNRRAYDDESAAEWERSMRMNRTFVLMMVDIDHFKQVNDVHGHVFGDQALVAVGKALRDGARQYDSVFRFGGEEFVIMVPECDINSANLAAERYREAIEAIELPLETGILKITASIGVAAHTFGNPGTLETLLEKADKLLYQAKKFGRNRVCSDCEPNPVA